MKKRKEKYSPVKLQDVDTTSKAPKVKTKTSTKAPSVKTDLTSSVPSLKTKTAIKKPFRNATGLSTPTSQNYTIQKVFTKKKKRK